MTVFCLASSEPQALQILKELQIAGFAADDISALVPDRTGSRDFGYEYHTKASPCALWGGLVGGAIGAALGGLISSGLLPREIFEPAPVLAALARAGPPAAALSGAAVVGAAGAVVGALRGLAIGQFVASRFDGKVPDANILLSVHCADRRCCQIAMGILRRSGAKRISKARGRIPPGSH